MDHGKHEERKVRNMLREEVILIGLQVKWNDYEQVIPLA
jgi:hypothetical protein